MKIARVHQPSLATSVITYATAKSFLRLNADTDQTLVEGMIAAATADAESYCERCFVAQTVTVVTNAWDEEIILFGANAASLSVTYYDLDNALQTLAAGAFILDNSFPVSRAKHDSAYTLPEVYNRPDAITFSYSTGYGATAATDVPAPIRQAVLFLTAEFYENRTPDLKELSVLSKAAYNLLSAYKLNHAFF